MFKDATHFLSDFPHFQLYLTDATTLLLKLVQKELGSGEKILEGYCNFLSRRSSESGSAV